MNLAGAAKFFDDQPVLDAYSNAHLFYGHMDIYDFTERDSETGWRRSVSTDTVVAPARGCVKVGTEVFLAGRVVSDFFQGEVVRRHLLLHPADELVSLAADTVFLAAGVATQLYAAFSWIKNRKEEDRTSDAYPVYSLFVSPTETVSVGQIVKDTSGEYYRVKAINHRSGGLLTAIVYALGADALRTISYVAAGDYDVASGSSSASAPISIPAFVETGDSAFEYEVNASQKYAPADRVVTVLAASVAQPTTADRFTDQGREFRVIDKVAAGAGWVLHGRPV